MSEQIERLIRRNKAGFYYVVFSRYVRKQDGGPRSRASCHGSFKALDEARGKRDELEAANPPRRPGRKPQTRQ